MEHATKERLISIISCDKLFIRVRLAEGTITTFALRSPTTSEKALAAIAYDESLRLAISEGMLTEAAMLDELDNRGIWTEEDDQIIEGLKEDITKIKRGMLDYIFQTDKLEKIRSTLRRAEQAYVNKFTEKQRLLTETAEAYALINEQKYIIGCISENKDSTPVWPNEASFEACADIILINRLSEFYFQTSRISEGTLREIARTEPWRTIWNSAKTVGELFVGPPIIWTQNQKSLAGWSKSYDVAFEAYERPSMDIVKDDDLLDSWFIREADKANSRAHKNSVKPSTGRQKGRQELFIPASKEGAKRVYELNDASGRQRVKVKQKELERKGRVKEQDMSDSQREMRQTLMTMRNEHVKGKK
jgi:hypothetical protein